MARAGCQIDRAERSSPAHSTWGLHVKQPAMAERLEWVSASSPLAKKNRSDPVASCNRSLVSAVNETDLDAGLRHITRDLVDSVKSPDE